MRPSKQKALMVVALAASIGGAAVATDVADGYRVKRRRKDMPYLHPCDCGRNDWAQQHNRIQCRQCGTVWVRERNGWRLGWCGK